MLPLFVAIVSESRVIFPRNYFAVPTGICTGRRKLLLTCTWIHFLSGSLFIRFTLSSRWFANETRGLDSNDNRQLPGSLLRLILAWSKQLRKLIWPVELAINLETANVFHKLFLPANREVSLAREEYLRIFIDQTRGKL